MKIRKGKRLTSFILDPVDTGIIEVLQANGRASNQEIAERLNVTAATVSVRLNRMEESRVIKVVAVTDFAAHQFNILIAVGVRVVGRTVQEVADDLAALPEVFSINIMHGAFDIEMLVALHEFDEIRLFLIDHVAAIPGISELSPGIAADIVKFEFHVAPL